MARLTVCGLVVLSASSAFAQQQPHAGYQQLFDQNVEELLATNDPGLQIALLEQLPAYNDVPIAYVQKRMEEVLEKTTNPLLHFRVHRWLVAMHQEQGDWSAGAGGMQGELGQQGCVTDFSLAGSFANDSMGGFYEQLPPERGEAAPYDGKGSTEVNWRTLPAFQNRCTLNLDVAVEQHRDAVVFLSTTIDSKKRQDARILLGVSGSYKVWLDGEPVAYRKEDTGFYVDANAWKLPLKKGKQQLVIKLGSSEGNSLDAIVRITDRSLKPLGAKAVSYSADWKPSKLQSFDGFTLAPTEQGAAQRAVEMGKSEDPHQAVLGAILLKGSESRNASTPWRDIADRLDRDYQSGKLKGFAVQDVLRLASLFEERWKRLEVREFALQEFPDDPWLLRVIAHTYKQSGTLEKRMEAGRLFERIVKEHPEFVPGVLDLAEYWQDLGFAHKALALLQSNQTPANLEIMKYKLALIRILETLSRTQEAVALREASYATHGTTLNADWHRAEELLAQNKLSEALPLIREHRAHYPWSEHWLMKEVDVLRAMGNVDGALGVLDERLGQVPGELSVLKKKADVLVSKGDVELAVQTLNEVKALAPQDQFVEDYIAYLQPSMNSFHEAWMVTDLESLSDAMDAGPFHASTLLDQKIIKVNDNGLSQYVVQEVARINTEEGINDASIIRIPYQTNDEQVDILRVRVIKPDGSFSEDYDTWSSANSRKGSTTYNDGGTITVQANNAKVGDMVEFRYRVRNTSDRNFRGDYFGDVEYVQDTTPIGMVRYAILYPEKIGPLYFRAPSTTHQRIDDKPPEGAKLDEGYKSTVFELKDVPLAKTEQNQPGYTEVYDHIIVSNKETIDELGSWWWNLVEEQLIVDDNIRQKVNELTKGLKTDDEKVRAIHNYVVQNTRYLHVGLGIHGWKPYRTTTCFRNRYGDCKDKAALLKVMLEEAGVKANLVLVRTRRLGEIGPYPASMNVFNHAIAYVPSMDLFLDGTAEFNGTRELTTMDQSAQALIIEDGGKSRWVNMPVDKPEVNTLKQTMTFDLTGDEPSATIEMVASGTHAVYFRSALEDPDRRDEVMAKNLAATYPGAVLEKATYSDLKKLEQPVTITLKIKGGKIMQGSEDKPFMYPLVATNDLLGAYASKSSRDQDLIIRVPYTKQYEIKYVLPKGSTISKLPQGKTLKSKFGSLNIEYKEVKGALEVKATYSIDTHRVSVDEYEDFRAFARDVTGTLNEAIELESK